MFKQRFSCLQLVIRRNNLSTRLCSTQSEITNEEKEKELERIAKDDVSPTATHCSTYLNSGRACTKKIKFCQASIDEPPTACCRSGCSNCVFIVWAEALANKMHNSGPEISEKILKMVDDPSMRAYLEMELRLRGLNK